jgi:hypothetical protein
VESLETRKIEPRLRWALIKHYQANCLKDNQEHAVPFIIGHLHTMTNYFMRGKTLTKSHM